MVFRQLLRNLALPLLVALVLVPSGPATATTGPAATQAAPKPVPSPPPVKLLILRENGVGAASTAQRYVDALVARMAQVNGWPAAQGHYTTHRDAGRRWIATEKPDYALLSLPALLALSSGSNLRILGSADVPDSGGRRYHVVTSEAKDLAACKGAKLSSNHADDPQFINRVVAGDAFQLSDFELLTTRRPIQTLKKVIRGEARCALIDDAQYRQLPKLRDAGALRSVWQSKLLPPLALVALPTADKKATRAMQNKLARVCLGDGAKICEEAGIKALLRATPAKYRSVMQAYRR